MGRALDGLRAYGLIAVMWIRSTAAYRTSFLMTAIGSFTASGLSFAAILLMFSHIETLGGLPLPEVALLYGTSNTALGLADLALGNMVSLGQRARDGTLDTLLVRPAPVLAQVAADRFALRRIGRIGQGVLVLIWALAQADVAWTPLKILLVPVMLISGAAIFGAVYVVGAAFQFCAQDAAEVQSSFTYGGNALLQYPPAVFAKEVVWGATFVIPLAFVNWLPVLYILDRGNPLGLPPWLAFAAPVVATALCATAGLAWRAGLRGYRSAGS